MALAGVVIEQDSAYWEAHIEIMDSSKSSESEKSQSHEIMFGVATKKDRSFYKGIDDGGTFYFLFCYIYTYYIHVYIVLI